MLPASQAARRISSRRVLLASLLYSLLLAAMAMMLAVSVEGARAAVYAGPVFSADPSTHDFGNQDVNAGSTASQSFTVRNTGGNGLGITTVSTAGANADQFQIIADTCTGASLASGTAQTCTVTATFDPSSAGAASASLSFAYYDVASPSNTGVGSIAVLGTGSGSGTTQPLPPLPPPDFCAADPVPAGCNLAPVAQATAWPALSRKGKAKYLLDGTASYDPDGTLAAYQWTLAGKVVGAASTLTQKLRTGKTYTYALRVTDNAGLTNTTTVKVKPPVGKIKKPIRLRLQTETLFAFDHYDLTSSARKSLVVITKRLRKLGAKKLTVNGYTDALGTSAYNKKLSTQRATTVGALLGKQLRLAKSKVKEKGYGETHPVAPNTVNGADSPGGRARNRRVEITAFFR